MKSDSVQHYQNDVKENAESILSSLRDAQFTVLQFDTLFAVITLLKNQPFDPVMLCEVNMLLNRLKACLASNSYSRLEASKFLALIRGKLLHVFE